MLNHDHGDIAAVKCYDCLRNVYFCPKADEGKTIKCTCGTQWIVYHGITWKEDNLFEHLYVG